MKPTERSMAWRRDRQKLLNDARAILDVGPLDEQPADQRTRYDKLDADIDTLTSRIETEERAAEREAAAAATIEHPTERGQGGAQAPGSAEATRALRQFLRSRGGGDPTMRLVGGYEERALQADSDTAGGFTVDPQSFVAQLIKFVDDQVFIRQRATVMPVMSADSLGAPSLDADIEDADWTTELDTGTDDATMAFGKRELHPHPLAKGIKVSRTLMRRSALPVEQLVRDRMGYKFGVTQEKAYMTGDGFGKPLGLFVASANGISTGRDVSTGNAATEIGADGLIEALYSLKGQYQARARWVFHRSAVKQIRKLKDGNGQYLWQGGLTGGQPATILDKPFDMSEYVPSTFTTGQYVGLVGDLSFYWIADALSMEIQRLDELYARTNQAGFIGRLESDGMPVLEEAFARVKLG